MIDDFQDYLSATSVSGWDLLLAIAVLIAGWIVGRLASRGIRKLSRRWPGVTEDVAKLVARIVSYALLLLAIGIALTVLGASLQPVLAAAIIVTAVGVLALRGIAANFGAGVVIQARGTVHIGDEIAVLGEQGTVRELNGRSVTLLAADGRTVRVPNAALLDSPLVNYTEHGAHRSEIEVRLRGDLTHADAARLITSTLTRGDLANDAPPVTMLLIRSAPASLTFRVRFWHETRDRDGARAAAIGALADTFAGEGIPAAIDAVPPPPPLAISPGP